MSNGLTFEILIQISRNFQGMRRYSWKECLQNFMEIDLELTEKSAKNTQRWWKLTATRPIDIKQIIAMKFSDIAASTSRPIIT